MSTVNATPLMTATQLQSLDIESALMAVQGQRATLLEEQLKGQLQDVQQRNAQIGKLNEALAAARELTARFSDKDNTSTKPADLIKKEKKEFSKSAEWKAEAKSIKDSFSKEDRAIYDADGLQLLIKWGKEGVARKKELDAMLVPPDNRTATGMQIEKLTTAAAAANITVDASDKGKLEKAIENLKSMIDSHSNSQQMDMLRLQSLSNKRNEAFEVMTNFIKKMQDSRSSIVGNLR